MSVNASELFDCCSFNNSVICAAECDTKFSKFVHGTAALCQSAPDGVVDGLPAVTELVTLEGRGPKVEVRKLAPRFTRGAADGGRLRPRRVVGSRRLHVRAVKIAMNRCCTWSAGDEHGRVHRIDMPRVTSQEGGLDRAHGRAMSLTLTSRWS